MSAFDKWQGYWQEDHTPWAYEAANDALFERYSLLKSDYGLEKSARVLVPLCGHSPVLRFFYDQGHSVYGVEYVPEAVEQLVSEHFSELSFERREEKGAKIFSAERLEIIQGDFFSFSRPKSFDLVYDRAALIAVLPKERQAYAEVICNSLSQEGLLFVVTFDFTPRDMSDTPYPVPAKELCELFSSLHQVHESEEDFPVISEKLAARGVKEAKEVRAIFSRGNP